MGTSANDIGVIGLGVMGRNLVLNIAGRGFRVAVFNRNGSVTREFASTAPSHLRVAPCYSLEELVAALSTPRRVLMMVKAGPPVDQVIESLRDLLEPGDVLMDGGNSHFRDTERREALLAAVGIRYLGVGISGGEHGARHGPSLMPGGSPEAYELVRPILEAIAARVDGRPCVAHLGRGAAGHYVKMAHNGIEYGFMQLIAESYALLKQVLDLDNEQLAAVYAAWNEAELESYLVQITADIFRRRDSPTDGYLVDAILGEAGQLGTGAWTSQNAMELQAPVPSIDVAVSMRGLSALGEGRSVAGNPDGPGAPHSACPLTVDDIRGALYASMVLTYAQGFALLQAASNTMGYDLSLEKVAAIWRGGCIIRARLLHHIRAAFGRRPGLTGLLGDEEVACLAVTRRDDLVRAVAAGASAGVPVPGFMSALAYLDAMRAGWLPFNLIQAQRDYFGAHEYRRIDREGVFHTDWRADDGATDGRGL